MNAIKENKLESFSQVTASLFAREVKGNSDENRAMFSSIRLFCHFCLSCGLHLFVEQ